MNVIIAYFEDFVKIAGGLEKSICNLANELDARGHFVTIVIFDTAETEAGPYYPLRENVSLINLNENPNGRLSVRDRLVREFRRVIGGKKSVREWKLLYKRRNGTQNFYKLADELKTDVIISFDSRTGAEIFCQHLPVPMISCIRNEPSIRWREYLPVEKDAMRSCAAIQVLLPDFVEETKKLSNNSRVFYIPNAIAQEKLSIDSKEHKSLYRIVNVARLTKKQKRQELLIKAFARIAGKYPKWIVELYGEDPSGYKQELQSLVRDFHLERRVLFKGTTHEVSRVLKKADIFAFPSAYEGFPNALGEAMAAGLPVVACADCTSCAVLITNGVDGLLAKSDADSFSEALEILMKDQNKRLAMGMAAHESMKQFAPENVWGQWESLLAEVTAETK